MLPFMKDYPYTVNSGTLYNGNQSSDSLTIDYIIDELIKYIYKTRNIGYENAIILVIGSGNAYNLFHKIAHSKVYIPVLHDYSQKELGKIGTVLGADVYTDRYSEYKFLPDVIRIQSSIHYI